MRRSLLRAAAFAVALLLVPHAVSAQSTPNLALKLPFPAGSSWRVLQGYNGGTHVPGPERYALDLVRDDGATANADVVAPVSGTMWYMNAPGAGNGCLSIKGDGGSGLIVQMCHIFARPFRVDERIEAGQALGTIGPNGTVGNNGMAHLHLSMHRTSDYGVTRVPVPFAAPNGVPLDGVTLVPDGSYNQFACPGSTCRGALLSTNGRTGGGATTPAAPANPAAGPRPASAPLAAPPPGVVQLRVGVIAKVTGGDCLNVREGPGISAKVLTCVPDGRPVTIAQGPILADGRSWWRLDGIGWAVGDYLLGITAPTPTLAVGATALVNAGDGDCLNMRDAPGMAGTLIGCLANGARLTITAGPRDVDDRIWWQLDGRGWAAADYLRPKDD